MSAHQSALTQKHRQNANFLQLGGIINRLYAVMTIFAQRFNICSSKLERSTAHLPPWLRTWQQWLVAIWYCLDPFVTSAHP